MTLPPTLLGQCNAGIHVAAGLRVAVRKSRCRPLTCNSLVRRSLFVALETESSFFTRLPCERVANVPSFSEQ